MLRNMEKVLTAWTQVAGAVPATLAAAIVQLGLSLQGTLTAVLAAWPAATLRQWVNQPAAATYNGSPLGEQTIAIVVYGPKGTDGEADTITCTALSFLNSETIKDTGWAPMMAGLGILAAASSDTATITIRRLATGGDADKWITQFTP